MSKPESIEPIEDDEVSTSSIELKPKKEKLVKEKKPYVLTEARKNAFEIARQKRDENRATRKIEKEKQEIESKKELEEKIVKKAELIKKKNEKKEEILKLGEDSSSDSEPEVIVQRVKKPKKKIIVVESDSEDEIVIQKRKPKIAPTPETHFRKYPMYV